MFVNQLNKVFKGSSWDNGTVAHEWGHYISNRLVGNGAGLGNQQGGSMGEGFGDFHALLLLSAEEDAMVAGNAKQPGHESIALATVQLLIDPHEHFLRHVPRILEPPQVVVRERVDPPLAAANQLFPGEVVALAAAFHEYK